MKIVSQDEKSNLKSEEGKTTRKFMISIKKVDPSLRCDPQV